MTSPSQEEPKGTGGMPDVYKDKRTSIKPFSAPVPNEPSDNIEVIERYEHGVPSEYSLDGGKTWKTKYEPSDNRFHTEARRIRQFSKAVIGRKAEPSAIGDELTRLLAPLLEDGITAGQIRAVRSKVNSLIEEQTKLAREKRDAEWVEEVTKHRDVWLTHESREWDDDGSKAVAIRNHLRNEILADMGVEASIKERR